MPAATCTASWPAPRDLEVDAVLALQGDFAIVQPPRRVHDAERADQFIRRQPRKTFDSG